MKFYSVLFVLLFGMLTMAGCKKPLEQQLEDNTVAKKITINGKAARHLTSYYPGTKIVAIRSTMIGNKMHGKALYWYKNGKLKHIQYWKMGMRVGVWLFYNKQGKMVERVDYDAMIRKERELLKNKAKKGGKEPQVGEPGAREPSGKKKDKDEDFSKMLKKERMKSKKGKKAEPKSKTKAKPKTKAKTKPKTR